MQAIQIAWNNEDLSLLQDYRHAHRLETPPAFHSQRNRALLTNPGIGRASPTMVHKKKQRKVSKDQLALAVRKNFNSAAVIESRVAVDFLYKVRFQGKFWLAHIPRDTEADGYLDKSFRVRSNPVKSKNEKNDGA